MRSRGGEEALRPADGAERQPATEDAAIADDVRNDAEVGLRPSRSDAEASGAFVEDEGEAEAGARRAQVVQPRAVAGVGGGRAVSLAEAVLPGEAMP